MSEEDAALFWRVDTPTDPMAGKESASQTLEPIEATPAEGLCLETTTLAKQARATNAPTVDHSVRETTSAEIAQDTKPAIQPKLLTR